MRSAKEPDTTIDSRAVTDVTSTKGQGGRPVIVKGGEGRGGEDRWHGFF